jgi:hypothetical protein
MRTAIQKLLVLVPLQGERGRKTEGRGVQRAGLALSLERDQQQAVQILLIRLSIIGLYVK